MQRTWPWMVALLALAAVAAANVGFRSAKARPLAQQEGPLFAPLAIDLDDLPPTAELAPVVDLPAPLRTPNWGGGSCVHASTVHLLHWQGQHELAAWWRSTYSGGEYATRLHDRLDAAGLKYAYTTSGDVAFLEWALRTRRGAGITYYPQHAVNLVHLDAEWAGLLDNNRVDQVIWIPRDEFVRRWRSYGGWAWTLVYNPPPPLPYLVQE